MQDIIVLKPEARIEAEIHLPSSKSESNRALIIQALARLQSGATITLQNVSQARDTQTMQRLLSSSEDTLDVLDAGTTMRFLTAYLALSNQTKVLTGTARMQERPILLLVDALRSIGFSMEYLANEGFPPLRLIEQENFEQKTDRVSIRGDVSSQYVSALLMIAPLLPQGLSIEIKEPIFSRPYIEMTLALMQHFGVSHRWEKNLIHVAPQTYQENTYTIESDWSAASYWFSIVSLCEGGQVFLKGLKENSLQGDRVVEKLMRDLGVRATFQEGGILLEQKPIMHNPPLQIDFSACPDLAQTLISLCAVKKLNLISTGLESLRIKETDRIAALKKELKKFGCEIHEDYNYWSLRYEEWAHTRASQLGKKSPINIETYDDHRMAMAFAPLALLHDLKIKDSEVVRKSYPHFWDDLRKAGFKVKEAA